VSVVLLLLLLRMFAANIPASCMRRLHTNLAYLAALADRKAVQAPPYPAYLMPPPLNLSLKLRVPQNTPDEVIERPPDPNADREERDQALRDLYKRLQALFPGVDPRKEPPPPASQMPNQRAAAAAAQQPNQVLMKNQNGQMMAGSNHGSPAPGPHPQKTPQMASAVAPMMHSHPAGL